jgi:hypothetical protein
VTAKAAEAVATEAIAEAAYQLAEGQAEGRRDGIAAALAILCAIADRGGPKSWPIIAEELAAYEIPFAALEIGTGGQN